MSTNLIVLTGRLTRDPELKYTQAGKAVCSFSMAVSSGFGDNEETDFFNCSCWEKQAEVAAEYLRKGSKVLIKGKMRSKTSEKDGKKTTYWAVQVDPYGGLEFLDTKGSSGNENSSSGKPSSGSNKNNSASNNVDDDEFPF